MNKQRIGQKTVPGLRRSKPNSEIFEDENRYQGGAPNTSAFKRKNIDSRLSNYYMDENSESDCEEGSRYLQHGGSLPNTSNFKKQKINQKAPNYMDDDLESDREGSRYLQHGGSLPKTSTCMKRKKERNLKPSNNMDEVLELFGEGSRNLQDISIIHPNGSVISLRETDAADEFIVSMETSTKSPAETSASASQERGAGKCVTMEQLYEMQLTLANKMEKAIKVLSREDARQNGVLDAQGRLIAEIGSKEVGSCGKRLKVTKGLRDDVIEAHRSLDNQYKGKADGQKLNFRSAYNETVTASIKRIVRDRQPTVSDALLHVACQRRFESFVRYAAEHGDTQVIAMRRQNARRKALYERRKKAIKEGETFDDVTPECMSDEEDGEENGVKVFVRHTPQWRAHRLTTLIRALDERLDSQGKPAVRRRYGTPATRRAPPTLNQKYIKMTN